ncbi:MAG: cytochrome c-type biosis protein CcmF [Thermoplasmata archaeon]|jgi:cytochrome c-type biogenesis protein CcmF|nr:cytochrome c-type biosis protein CcmF [Thermoplasmata archaeon]
MAPVLGDALLWLGVALGAVAVAAWAWAARDPARGRLARAASLAAAAPPVVALLYLVGRFLASDLTVEAVFYYSRSDLAWQWKLAGTWAGREGSLLLWTAMLAAVCALVARPLDKAKAWTMLMLHLALLAFLWSAAQGSPFGATPPSYLAGRPLGNGLNPTLKSPFILIHPPIMFAAYAATAVPAAAAFAHWVAGEGGGVGKWSRDALRSSRVAWLLFTAAIGLGAMWAYYTLGFGGYWAWDPVEVANLLPWLALTLYLHTQLHHLRHGAYALLGPALAVLPFLLSLFSTISTRSGLWVSVHAFTDPTDTFDPDAATRFLDILRLEPSLRDHVGLFGAVLLAGLALWSRSLAAATGRMRLASRAVAGILGTLAVLFFLAPTTALSVLLEASTFAGGAGYGFLVVVAALFVAAALPALLAPAPPKEPRHGLARVNLRSLNGYAVLALGLALLVLFLFHMAATGGWSTAFYEARFPYLTAPIALGLLVFQGHQIYGRKRSIVLAALAFVAALVCEAVRPNGGGTFLLALAAILVYVSLDRVRRAAPAPGTPRRVRRGHLLLWLGALVDLLFWLNPPTVRLGPLAFEVPLALQAVGLAAAVVLLWLTTRQMAGAPGPAAPLALGVAMLGGFYVAPVLALLGLALARGHRPAGDPNRAARLKQVGLYGVHLALAVALLGYAPSTYQKETVKGTLADGQTLELAGHTLRLDAVRTHADGAGVVDQLEVVVDAGQAPGRLAAEVRYEETAGAHFPTPAALRLWDGDLYLEVEAVQAAPGSPCARDGAAYWVESYQGGPRLCEGHPVQAVRVEAVHLPWLGLVWLALALGVLAMVLVMGGKRP